MIAPATDSRRRLHGLASLGLLAGYSALILLESRGTGGSFASTEPFPLGGLAGQGGMAVRAVSLLLAVCLGWGIPGTSLALLANPRLDGAALLARALGAGVGYIFLTGVAYGLVTGHAPHREIFLVLLALPCLAAALCRGDARGVRVAAHRTTLLALLAILLLTALLWPRLRYEALNGDGTEAYELSRSLADHPFPRWDLEGDSSSPRFGTPIVVPYFTGAFTAFGEMTILGRSELAVRLPFVWSLVIVAATAIGLAKGRGPSAWLYTLALSGLYVLWSANYMGYEPPMELAEHPGSDTITIALWLAGAYELMLGVSWLGIAFMVLASATTYAAPLLTAIALVALWGLHRRRGTVAFGWAIGAFVLVAPAFALFGWYSGDWPHWVRQFTAEYLNDFVESERVPSLPLFGRLVLLTGALPFVAFFRYRRLSLAGKVLLLTGTGYLCVVLAGNNKNLHYVMPLPWLFMVPALEASGTSMRAAAIGVIAFAAAFSWPGDRDIRRQTAILGTESCVQDLGYEAAAFQADPIYQALDVPVAGERFAVGKHTFVRYALDLGGKDCVVGLSPVTPSGAITLIDGAATIWTTDPDRYARWRFTQVTMPSSRLFPRPARVVPPSDAESWSDRRLDLTQTPGRWLVLETAAENVAAESTGSALRVRLMVPMPSAGLGQVLLGVRAIRPTRVTPRINGVATSALDVVPGTTLMVEGAWRKGWNILELHAQDAIDVNWLDARTGATP